MRAAWRSKIGAALIFALVAVVVLGGMSWATLSTVELARQDMRNERARHIAQALWRMDTYVGGVLRSEMARPFEHYYPFHTVEPVEVWSNDGVLSNAERVLLRSPIAEWGPPYEWITLYFHVSEDGTWLSPQVPDEGQLDHEACRRLAWLRDVLPVAELGEHMAEASERDRSLAVGLSELQQQDDQPRTHKIVRGPGSSVRNLPADYRQRGLNRIAAQLNSRPSTPQCLVPGIESNVAIIVEAEADAPGDSELSSVGISRDPMASFWLRTAANERPQLAFVRSGHEGGNVVYQGFVADWFRLQEELLRQVDDLFTDVELVPVPNDRPPEPQFADVSMTTIPIRLQLPDNVAAASTDAWQSVAGLLVITWAAAVATLFVVGLGIRNLVALTERRMQFAYAVTHELRTPLTTFRLYSDMLSADMVPDASKKEYLDTLNRESQRLSSLVEGVLEYARLENHKVRLKPVATDGQALLTAVEQNLLQQGAAQRVETRTHNDIPPQKKLYMDVNVITQIAGVLVNNACRHAREAETPQVLIHLASPNGQLQLDIADSGRGVDRSDARAIFKAFRRGRRADDIAQGGIGLGLALARGWARLLGGRLDLVARHHRELGGAHFRLTIPADRPS